MESGSSKHYFTFFNIDNRTYSLTKCMSGVIFTERFVAIISRLYVNWKLFVAVIIPRLHTSSFLALEETRGLQWRLTSINRKRIPMFLIKFWSNVSPYMIDSSKNVWADQSSRDRRPISQFFLSKNTQSALKSGFSYPHVHLFTSTLVQWQINLSLWPDRILFKGYHDVFNLVLMFIYYTT